MRAMPICTEIAWESRTKIETLAGLNLRRASWSPRDGLGLLREQRVQRQKTVTVKIKNTGFVWGTFSKTISLFLANRNEIRETAFGIRSTPRR